MLLFKNDKLKFWIIINLMILVGFVVMFAIGNPTGKEQIDLRVEERPNAETITELLVPAPSGTVIVLTLEQAKKVHLEKAGVFVDARPKESFDKGHIPDAISVPNDSVEQHPLLPQMSKVDPLILYCSSTACSMSSILAKTLITMDFQRVFLFEGGMKAWQEAGLPIQSSSR